MTYFEQCLAKNGLGEMLKAEFGKWGEFSQTAADLVLEVSDLESISPELLGFTWVKESCFVLTPFPNINCPCRQVWPHDKPECNGNVFNPFAWDIGPLQTSIGWGFKSAWVGEYSVKGLHYDQCFGKEFYKEGKPCAFTGSPIANLRLASRRLLARKGDDEHRAVEYPGPLARPNRREGWKKYGSLMAEFFKKYGEGK